MTKQEIPAGSIPVEISRQPVELYKVLKFEGLVGSGGEAKTAVASGQVRLNGETETQKRKKVVAGDTIEFGTDKLFIVLASITEPSPDKPIAKKPRAAATAKPRSPRAAITLAKRGK
jgi:ribosome-associated protein